MIRDEIAMIRDHEAEDCFHTLARGWASLRASGGFAGVSCGGTSMIDLDDLKAKLADALAQQSEEQDEHMPSSIARDRGLIWLLGWYDVHNAAAPMIAEIEALRARVAVLEGALADAAGALAAFVNTHELYRQPYEHLLSAYDRACTALEGAGQ